VMSELGASVGLGRGWFTGPAIQMQGLGVKFACMETQGKDSILPKTLPVMVFEGACLFPQTMLPLFVFEPRYREMLTFALETDRLIVLSRPEGSDDVAAMGCVGLIRTCVSLSLIHI
jgi:hypothetical protein